MPFIVKLITFYNEYKLLLKFSFPPSRHCLSVCLSIFLSFLNLPAVCLVCFILLCNCNSQNTIGRLLIRLWFLITSFWTSIIKILEIFITVLHITDISFISSSIGFCCCCSDSLFLSTSLQVHSFASNLLWSPFGSCLQWKVLSSLYSFHSYLNHQWSPISC